jgi:hypothetical protein
MGNTVEIAKEYAGKNGLIVVLSVSRDVRITDRSDRQKGYYVCEIPNAKPKKKYYRIKGIEPVGLLDAKGKWLTYAKKGG